MAGKDKPKPKGAVKKKPKPKTPAGGSAKLSAKRRGEIKRYGGTGSQLP